MTIPFPDLTYTTDKLHEEADLFLAAGKRYWNAAHKAGISGAVIWVQDTEQGFVLFSRGEYKNTILQNITQIGPERSIGNISDES